MSNIWWAVRLGEEARGRVAPDVFREIRLAVCLPDLNNPHCLWFLARTIVGQLAGRTDPLSEWLRETIGAYVQSPVRMPVWDLMRELRIGLADVRGLPAYGAVRLWMRAAGHDRPDDDPELRDLVGAALVELASHTENRAAFYRAASAGHALALGYQRDKIGIVRRHRAIGKEGTPRRVKTPESAASVPKRPRDPTRLGRWYVWRALAHGWPASELGPAVGLSVDELRRISRGQKVEPDVLARLEAASAQINPSLAVLPPVEAVEEFLRLTAWN